MPAALATIFLTRMLTHDLCAVADLYVCFKASLFSAVNTLL